MTNDDLNRAVAEARGWKAPTMSTTRLNPYGNGIDVVHIPFPPPNYCTDPAAWGALLVVLAEEGHKPGIEEIDGVWTGSVYQERGDEREFITREADTPGRALCLAYLASIGKEVS
jgi:hypothetical protein